MKKAIILLIALLMIGTLLFSGCTQQQPADKNINSDSTAAKAISDVSSDILGVKNSLNEIDQNLTDQNSP